MPLTVCPNCQSPMSEVSRRGVYVDICPQCRGVWLDGGELEKLLEAADGGAAAAPTERRYVRRDEYVAEHRDKYHDDNGRARRKRRGGGVFDLFEDLFD